MNNKKAIQVFKEYVSNYDINDDKIKIKISHILRVAALSKRLAKLLKLNDEDVSLAELIGLLHDIGRFEQVKRYHTFIDKDSINHAEYGVSILFKDNFIRKFIEDDKYDEIIKKAILNHNRARIENNLNDKELLHSKIIRDCDKIDILYLSTTESKKSIWEKEDLSDDIISEKIYDDFINKKEINYKNINSSADILICHFAYIFDFNYLESLKYISDQKYINKIYKRFQFNDEKTNERYQNIYKYTQEYIREKLKN